MTDKELMEEYISKLDFSEHFLRSEFPKVEKRLDELAKKIQTSGINKEYFENLKKEIEANRKKLLKIIEREYELFDKKAKEIEEQKDYLVNVMEIIDRKRKNLERTNSIFTWVNISIAVIIFFVSALLGFGVGYVENLWEVKGLNIQKVDKDVYIIDNVATAEKIGDDKIKISIKN
ncbi:hypothetical protein [Nitratiruptor sp. SB155-2]|uniref:hypothetical protein n=1 Tax=Nitratiruptor sp. (strain SB155-2) TaxID=387092 RepID=UPI000158740F|nr:hypothetical protein [Nitratiruptor sp. SB155-2]BAF70789.1 hypothetical protein NIS_1683 [Nitratiruptor sp. SB155-2]